MLPVPLNSWKMSSSMRLPVSIKAVATIVNEPASSVLRAAAKIFRVIFRHRIRDVMQQSGFTSARWRDDQAALAHPERRHQIHNPRGVAVRNGLELDPLVWVDRGQFFKRAETLIFGRILPVDCEKLDQLRAAAATAGFAVNPHSVTQRETAHDFRCHENVLGCLNKVPFRIPEAAEAFTGHLDYTLAVFRLASDLLSPFGCTFQCFGRNGIGAGLASHIIAGFVVRLVKAVSAIAGVI